MMAKPQKLIDAKTASPETASGLKTTAAVLIESGKTLLVERQPQSKEEEAVSAGMYLYTDDSWSLRYFQDGDLHCLERELFG